MSIEGQSSIENAPRSSETVPSSNASPSVAISTHVSALRLPAAVPPASVQLPAIAPAPIPQTVPTFRAPAANQSSFASQGAGWGAAAMDFLASGAGRLLGFAGLMFYPSSLGNGELTPEQRRQFFGTTENEDGKVATSPENGQGVIRDAEGEHPGIVGKNPKSVALATGQSKTPARSPTPSSVVSANTTPVAISNPSSSSQSPILTEEKDEANLRGAASSSADKLLETYQRLPASKLSAGYSYLMELEQFGRDSNSTQAKARGDSARDALTSIKASSPCDLGLDQVRGWKEHITHDKDLTDEQRTHIVSDWKEGNDRFTKAKVQEYALAKSQALTQQNKDSSFYDELYLTVEHYSPSQKIRLPETEAQTERRLLGYFTLKEYQGLRKEREHTLQLSDGSIFLSPSVGESAPNPRYDFQRQQSIPGSPRDEQARNFGHLFENSPAIMERTWNQVKDQLPINLGVPITTFGEPPLLQDELERLRKQSQARGESPPADLPLRTPRGREKGQAFFLFDEQHLSGDRSVAYLVRIHTNERLDTPDRSPVASVTRYVRDAGSLDNIHAVEIGQPGQILLGNTQSLNITQLSSGLRDLGSDYPIPTMQDLTMNKSLSVGGETVYVNGIGEVVIQQDIHGSLWLNTKAYANIRRAYANNRRLNSQSQEPIILDVLRASHMPIRLHK